MGRKITAQTRRELVSALRERYETGTRQEKARILDEFSILSGYHRKHAIRILNAPAEVTSVARRVRAPRLYDEATRQALLVLWEASDRVCGKRLKALLPILLAALERHGHLALSEVVRTRLQTISAATIDRLLGRAKGVAAQRRERRTPSVRRSVPIRTFADWLDPLPGSMEADLVAHCGPTAAGSFIHTLVLTDISSGWTECAPLVVRESTLVIEAVEQLRGIMPFPLRALDTDNGSEFVNEALLKYCASKGIELTRSRPYRKNDQAWVEQKNGAVVRRLVGYRRFEGITCTEALSRLYSMSRLFVNFFQPSFKLASKTRIGARVSKRYHPPQTPCARLLMSDAVPEPVKARLREIAEALDPLRLLDEIRSMQHQLVTLADGGQPAMQARDPDDLSRFLAGLATAWRAGEVRPTHAAKAERRHDWRTRADPFESVWPTVCTWLTSDPDQTARQLLDRLQLEHPGVYPDGQLRTLQRKLKDWRTQAAQRLVLGVPDSGVFYENPGSIDLEASGSILR